MNIKILKRYSEPGKADTANQFDLCSVGEYYYIQVSPNAENPNWQYVGEKNTDNLLFKLIEIAHKAMPNAEKSH